MTVYIVRSYVKNNSEMNKHLNYNNRGSKHPALRFTIKISYLLPVRSIQCRTVITIYCNRNSLRISYGEVDLPQSSRS